MKQDTPGYKCFSLTRVVQVLIINEELTEFLILGINPERFHHRGLILFFIFYHRSYIPTILSSRRLIIPILVSFCYQHSKLQNSTSVTFTKLLELFELHFYQWRANKFTTHTEFENETATRRATTFVIEDQSFLACVC